MHISDNNFGHRTFTMLRFAALYILVMLIYMRAILWTSIEPYEENGNWGRKPAEINVAPEDWVLYRNSKFDPCRIETPREALDYLDSVLHGKDRKMIASTDFKHMSRFHFGLGQSIRNTMCLWRGGPLSDWFKARGIDEPDTMSGYILDLYWARLVGCEVDAGEYIRKNGAGYGIAEEKPLECRDRLGSTYTITPGKF
jgi:hypothetical protein